MMKVFEVFWRFLALGCVSFGGPAAHIGYFQRVFVQKLNWVDAESYARLISLSQFLPGPGSSQIGFALGLRRAGIWGGMAAFAGFTLPSFLLLYILAVANTDYQAGSFFPGIIKGLKLLAVVVVADATSSMFKSFCKDKSSIALAVFTAVFVLTLPSIWTQLAALTVAALIGIIRSQNSGTTNDFAIRIRWFSLGVFLVLFIGLPVTAMLSPWLELLSDFYQSGSLVFGGGHVVLPLLQQTLGEAISTDRFLLGYAAAQAVPGPMFSLAAFLGAELSPGTAFMGAALATLGIFLPGFLLILSFQGAWEDLARRPKVAGAVWGINASVVGLLMSALYKPVFVSAVTSSLAMALVMIGLFALNYLRLPIVILVIAFAAAGALLL